MVKFVVGSTRWYVFHYMSGPEFVEFSFLMIGGGFLTGLLYSIAFDWWHG